MYALLESVHYRFDHSPSTCEFFHRKLTALIHFRLSERPGTLKSYEPSFCGDNPQQHSGKALISISYLESFFGAAAMLVYCFQIFGTFTYNALPDAIFFSTVDCLNTSFEAFPRHAAVVSPLSTSTLNKSFVLGVHDPCRFPSIHV